MLLRAILHTILVTTAVTLSEAGECTLGDVIEPNIPFISSGHYINLNSPAVCSGNLTAWHFCYYRASIDTEAPSYTLWFRVWRQASGNTYNRISNTQIQGAPNSTAGNLICEDVFLEENNYIQVEAGDVISVYVPVTLDTVSVLVFQPPVVQEVQQDTRGIVAFSSTEFRRNELTTLTETGIHLNADITFIDPPPTTAPAIPTTMATTVESTPQANTNNGPTSDADVQMSTTSGDSNATPSNDGGVVAAVVIVILVLVLAVAVGVTLFVVCYAKRKHGSLKGCLQSNRGRLLAMDNLIYRVGSDRIPIHLPKKKKRPTLNGDSQVYDIPRDRHDRRLYDIPRNNTPSVEDSLDYSVVRPLSQSISTVHSSEYNRVPTTHVQLNGTQNGQVSTQKEQDYIYMDNSNNTDGATNEKENKKESDPDAEVYIYLRYGTVEYHKLLSQATKDEEDDADNPFRVPPSNEEEIYVVLSEQQIKVIPRKAVETQERIGSGHFGNVDKGVWRGSKGTLEVAVKSLTDDAKQADKVRFLQEAAIMGQFKHPNITHIHGIVTQGEPLLLVLEYMPKGDLKRYLTAMRPEPNMLIPASVPKLLVSFSQQVALGMHYLASKGFVHRDLAARNIFVSEEETCKIGDFGMSRDVTEDGCYVGHGGKVPLKWTAPEAIHLKKYSTASDVWSYGCLLYEIWSLGRKPFRGMNSSKALQLIDTGYRLPPPPGCPLAIYDLMIKCWHPVATCRPKYRDILTSLLQDERKLLDIPVEDASTHAEACLLGASIEAGKHMYTPLQHCYNPDATDKDDPDYEYGETDNEDL